MAPSSEYTAMVGQRSVSPWICLNSRLSKESSRRQLAIKDQNSNSWFTHIRKLLQKYNLPTAYDLMERPPTKWKWKAMLNKAVKEYHTTEG
jgi:hypothetical protein